MNLRKSKRVISRVPLRLNPRQQSRITGRAYRRCFDCRTTTRGAGVELGVAVRMYLDVVVDLGVQPHASSLSSLNVNVGGSLFRRNFGVRSGYSGRAVAVKVTLAPGFASYSGSQSTPPTEADPNCSTRRNFNFSAVAALSGDIRFGQHFAFRTTMEQMVIRYKSSVRDPPGIGKPPRLSFLSHDNYINATN